MSAELMEMLMLADYCHEVDLFARDQPTDRQHLKCFIKWTSRKYNVDTASFYTRKSNPIPGGMNALFGKYNVHSADEVCKDLVYWADANREIVKCA